MYISTSPGVLNWELRSFALGALCRDYKVNRGLNMVGSKDTANRSYPFEIFLNIPP